MQFDDPRTILEAAAAKPTRGLDAAALLKEGARQRRTRLAAMAAGVAVVVIAASASFGALTDGGRDDARPGPAAPSPNRRCGEESNRVSLYLRNDVTADQGQSLAGMLGTQLRELSPGSDAAYVSKREAYRELSDYHSDPEVSWELQPSEVPARIDLENVDDASVVKIEKMLASKIDTIEQRTKTTSRDGVCVEVVEGAPPPDPLPGPNVDVSGRDRPRYAVVVEVRRAECRTGAVDGVAGSAELTDGSKWCRFVLFVDNRSGRPLHLDLDDQTLWTTNGHAVTPWRNPMFGDFSTRLFTSPIPPDTGRLGQVVFRLIPGDVPGALDVRPRPGFAPISLPLEYDCDADLREEPRGRCFFSTPTGPESLLQSVSHVQVELYHCGIEPLVLYGREWVVPDPPFDATNAPDGFTGRGSFDQRSPRHGLYFDESGEVIRFEAIEGWEPPPCA